MINRSNKQSEFQQNNSNRSELQQGTACENIMVILKWAVKKHSNHQIHYLQKIKCRYYISISSDIDINKDNNMLHNSNVDTQHALHVLCFLGLTFDKNTLLIILIEYLFF